MFAIGIRFLCGWSMATHPSDRKRPEWPPHPDRFFMALSSAFFESDRNPSERRALEWMEGLEPPALSASDFNPRKTITTFVPVNDTSSPLRGSGKTLRALVPMGSYPIGRIRQPRQFPVAVPHSDCVWMVWENVDLEPNHAEALKSLCGRVAYLGHSASLVQMWLDLNPPLPNLRPSEGSAELRMRVFGKGRLGYLEACYNEAAWEGYKSDLNKLQHLKGKAKADLKKKIEQDFGGSPPQRIRPVPGLWKGYNELRAANTIEPPPGSVFNPDIIIFAQAGGTRLGLESTLGLTRAFRGAVMKNCSQPPPEWISGHNSDRSKSSNPHLTIFPLAHIGHRHADGHLMGLAFSVPRSLDAGEVVRGLGDFISENPYDEPKSIKIKMGRMGEWLVKRETRENPPLALRSETWTAASKTWATVTPVVLDRYPKSEGDAEATISMACERIGLPAPKQVILLSVSPFVGPPHAFAFPALPAKFGRGKGLHTHALLGFHLPVQGPVLIGAGRFQGYGLCRPYQGIVGGVNESLES